MQYKHIAGWYKVQANQPISKSIFVFVNKVTEISTMQGLEYREQ